MVLRNRQIRRIVPLHFIGFVYVRYNLMWILFSSPDNTLSNLWSCYDERNRFQQNKRARVGVFSLHVNHIFRPFTRLRQRSCLRVLYSTQKDNGDIGSGPPRLALDDHPADCGKNGAFTKAGGVYQIPSRH